MAPSVCCKHCSSLGKRKTPSQPASLDFGQTRVFQHFSQLVFIPNGKKEKNEMSTQRYTFGITARPTARYIRIRTRPHFIYIFWLAGGDAAKCLWFVRWSRIPCAYIRLEILFAINSPAMDHSIGINNVPWYKYFGAERIWPNSLSVGWRNARMKWGGKSMPSWFCAYSSQIL